jgi:hypothetical protein
MIRFENNNGTILLIPGAKFLDTYPGRLTSVMAFKCDSNMY